MKKYFPFVIIGGLVVLMIFILIERSCDERISVKLARTEGLFSAYKETVEKEKKEWQKIREGLEADIKRALNEAQIWKSQSAENKEKVIAGNKEIQKLKEEFNVIEDKDEKIRNLQAQNIMLENNYNAALEGWAAEEQRALRLEVVISDKDMIIAGLERQLQNKDTLLKLSEDIAAGQRKEIHSLKTGKTLSQVLMIGGWTVAAYKTFIDK